MAKKQLPRATHSGVLMIGGVELPCCVLDDERATSVFVRGDLMEAFVGYRSGRRQWQEVGAVLPVFLSQKNLSPFVDRYLRSGQFEPIRFVGRAGRTETGIRASTLPVMCRIIMEAHVANALRTNQVPLVERAIAMGAAFMEIGIEALVHSATGFEEQRAPHHLENLLDLLLLDAPQPWQKRFPDSFWANIYRLRGWDWRGMGVNRPQVCAYYVCDLVYERINENLLPALLSRAERNDKGELVTNLHQFLTDNVGHVVLATHLDKVIMLMQLATTWEGFMQSMDKLLPRKGKTIEMFSPEATL